MNNLFDYQQKIVDDYPSKLGIWFDPGLGKTAIAISIAKKNNYKMLIVCPKTLLENWQREVDIWWPEATNYLIISKENFRKKQATLLDYDIMIIDESHIGFHNYSSLLFKAAESYRKNKNIKLCMLTGTPLTATYWSVYSIAKLQGLNWNWFNFRKDFFFQVQMGRRKIWSPKKDVNTRERIANLIKGLGYTLSLSDVRDVPEQQYVYEYFDLNPKQKKMLLDFADPNPAVYHLRKHQIESGAVKGDGYREDVTVDIQKDSRIIELCHQHKKIMIVARYNLQLDKYYNLLRKEFPDRIIDIINGSVDNRDEIITKHNDAESQILLVNAMCSAGYNLPKIPTMVFASMDYSYINYKQIRERIQRINNIKVNTYIYMITRGNSTDKAVFDSLMCGEDFNDRIYNTGA